MGQSTPADKLKNLATNYFDTNATVVNSSVNLATTSLATNGSKIYMPATVNGATAGTGTITAAVAPNGGFAEPGALLAIGFTDAGAAADQVTLTVTPAGWKAQGVSTLDQGSGAIAPDTTVVELATGTGALFPSSGTVYINGAPITYSGKSTDNLTGCDCTTLPNGATNGTRVVAAPVAGTMLWDGTGFVTVDGIGCILRWNGQSWDVAMSNFAVQLA